MKLWIIAAIALVGVLLLAVAIVLLVRRRKRAAPEAPKERSLSAVLADFRRRMPASARGDPVVVVLGERLAGKSRLADAAFDIGGGPLRAAPTSADDARITLHAGRQALVEELSGELLEDARPEARAALRGLWQPDALSIQLVLVVLDTHAPSWSPAGLRRLGALARARVDLITSLRGTPPRVRVCLTHLDESAEGFLELNRVARDTGHTGRLTIPGRTASELSAALSPLEATLPASLGGLSGAEISRLTRFLTHTGPRTLAALAPFLDPLLADTGGVKPPALDGLVLGGLPEAGAGADEGADAQAAGAQAAGGLLGDPLELDAAAVERDARALDRRRTITAIALGAAAAAALLIAYFLHDSAVDRASIATTAFRAAAERAMAIPDAPPSEDVIARGAEATAADALDDALRPLWLPLRVAYPDRKDRITDAFLQIVRDLYLIPPATGPDRVKRIYALSLLYASDDNALGERVLAGRDAWATELDVPVRVVDDYIEWSEIPWTGAVHPPARLGEVSLNDWQRYLDDVETALQHEKLTPTELADLQKKGADLAATMPDARDARGLEDVVKLLEEARGPEIDAFLGRRTERRAPEWVIRSWADLDGVLTLVKQANLKTPDARGAGLRKVVDDLTTIGRPGGDDTSEVIYKLAPDGRTREYPVRTWASLIRASRAAVYVQAFLDDVRSTARSPLFPRDAVYPPVGDVGSPSRGPRSLLPGLYTASVFEAELRPAFDGLDAALDQAHVPSKERTELTGLVRMELAHHADAHRAALWTYLGSFHLDAASAASLRTDLEDMVGPASWFTAFWDTLAKNAAIDPKGNAYLDTVGKALAPFQSITVLQADEKGKNPGLDKYYAVIAPLLPSLDAGAPVPPGPSDAPLADRLPPIGKLGLAVLDTDKPAPLPEVNAVLDGLKIHDKAFRRPFLLPVELIYELALRSVEQTLAAAYRQQVRPLVAPLLARFPFDPTAREEVAPSDAIAVVGPKGTFRVALADLLAPVCKAPNDRTCVPRAPLGYRAVRLPSDAVELSTWAAGLTGVLWDDAGKPKTIELVSRPTPLPQVRSGDAFAVTRSFLRSGDTTLYGFNQTPAWQPLPVVWSAPSVAAVGLELTEPGSVDPRVQTREAAGAAWRFYRLLCKAERVDELKVERLNDLALTWHLERAIAFVLRPDPWKPIVPPANRGRYCEPRAALIPAVDVSAGK